MHSQEIPTNLAIMVGYIQKESSNYWHTKVNEWIQEQINESSNPNITWNKEDLLSLVDDFSTSPKFTKHSSIHSRIDLPKIKLIHYWIDLN